MPKPSRIPEPLLGFLERKGRKTLQQTQDLLVEQFNEGHQGHEITGKTAGEKLNDVMLVFQQELRNRSSRLSTALSNLEAAQSKNMQDMIARYQERIATMIELDTKDTPNFEAAFKLFQQYHPRKAVSERYKAMLKSLTESYEELAAVLEKARDNPQK